MTRERIGIFGGSFNPPHKAHVLLVREALLHPQGVDRVLVIPTYQHAFGKQLAPYPLRMEMLRIAFAPPLFPEHLLSRVVFSTVEEELGGVSYTIETVRELKRQMPHADLHLLMGGDLVRECGMWRESAALLSLAPAIALHRVGTIDDDFPNHCAGQWLDGIELPEACSTDVRTLMSQENKTAAATLTKLLPPGIESFIRKHKLYL